MTDVFRKLTPEEILRDIRHGAELLAAAQGACERMAARQGESVEEWARTLAADLARHTD